VVTADPFSYGETESGELDVVIEFANLEDRFKRGAERLVLVIFAQQRVKRSAGRL